MKTSRPFVRSFRSGMLLMALVVASCGDATAPDDDPDDDDPIPGYPIVMRIVDADSIAEIKGVVLQGNEWTEVGVVLSDLSIMTRAMLSTDIETLKSWGLDLTLLSPTTWQYAAAASLAPAPYIREDDRFAFTNPSLNLSFYAYGDTTRLTMPMIVYYGESDDTGFIGGAPYDRDREPYGALDLDGFATDGSDTLFYRSYRLEYRPE